jgi:alkanesulfonate monooxygenase SsuD/methylene tetrahydromethanopterin reductase-like flavin-dependent oxidoreductase (luciferase family)
LPTTSPLRAAEEMSMLDLLADGRTEFGLGLGAGVPGAKPRHEKAAEYRALLADILRLLQGDRSTGLPELCPAADPGLIDRLWVAARDAETIAFAAGRNLNFVVGQAEIGPRQATLTRQYRQAGGGGRVRGERVVFAAETAAEAARDSEAAVRLYFGQMAGKSYHKEAVDAGDLPPTADTLAEMRRQVSFIAGTPAQVAAELNDYAQRLGLDQLDVMVQVPALPTDAIRRSLALIQNEVRPLLKVGGQTG